jgi:hypothetical protein
MKVIFLMIILIVSCGKDPVGNPASSQSVLSEPEGAVAPTEFIAISQSSPTYIRCENAYQTCVAGCQPKHYTLRPACISGCQEDQGYCLRQGCSTLCMNNYPLDLQDDCKAYCINRL